MRLMLFTSPTCKYCNPAKELLGDFKDLEIINILENDEMTEMYGIRAVPTLVVEKCSGTEKYTGLDKISLFIDEYSSKKGCGCGCHH